MSGQHYRAELVTEEPVSLGVESETAYRRDIYRYVPGIVLRGALAAVWIGEHGTPDGPMAPAFRELFEVGLRPGPLLPERGYLEPLSATRCKYPPDRCHRHESVRDQAFDEEPSGCCPVPECGRPVGHGRGEVTYPAGVDPVVTITHVPHDRQGAAADEQLHARQYLRPGLRFTGSLVAPAGTAWFESFRDGRPIWLGGRRTVAGRCRLTLTPQGAPAPAGVSTGDPLVIRLLAPAVLVDNAGRPTLDPTAELARRLDVEVDCQRGWTRPVVIRGWHVATRLPKPADHAVAAGSTWRLSFGAAVAGDRLAALLADGIGLRRTEGFGQLTIADQAWRPVSAPPVAAAVDPAVAEAAKLWSRIGHGAAGGKRWRRTVIEHLADLAGLSPHRWSDYTAQLWQQERGKQLLASGVKPALTALSRTTDPDLIREIQQVLAAADQPPTPHWLTQALSGGAR